MKKPVLKQIDGNSLNYVALIGLLGVFILAALGSAFYMEHNGHHVTGMNNQIVWGMPHVFAVFLIVAASGALNVASISSVFSKSAYKPLAPLSTLVALALLTGGLMILVLDLGRPDRLIVAMTKYNFKSIFAWNMILYNGFFLIVGIYMWTMLQRSMNKYSKIAGYSAFIWRLTLTTGTGSIFGFLIAREAYNSAVMAPMFIVMSFSFGLAIFLLILIAAYKWTNRPLGDVIFKRLKNLLGVFVAGVLYFVIVQHLTSLYMTAHHGVEAFILRDGGIYTELFWYGQIIFGSLIPLAIIYHPATGNSRSAITIAALLIVLGGLAQMYVIIIGGQAYPLNMFPGKEITSTFFDGMVNTYTPTLAETLLGLGGIAVSLIIVAFAVKILKFMPESLADDAVDPHYSK